MPEEETTQLIAEDYTLSDVAKARQELAEAGKAAGEVVSADMVIGTKELAMLISERNAFRNTLLKNVYALRVFDGKCKTAKEINPHALSLLLTEQETQSVLVLRNYSVKRAAHGN